MQWKKAGVMALILFSLFLASCTPASGPSADDIWDKVVKIGSLGFLGDSPENDLIALTRVLIFILIFALLFEGSKLTGLSRNSAIVVSAVLAIMSTIFIPASILLGIGAAYSTVIAILIVGAPVVGGLLVHRIFSGDSGGHKVARLFILVILSLYLFAVMNAAADYNGPLGLLANGILEFVWWGLLLIFFMLVWELFHSFQILGVGSALSSGSKGAWKAIKARFPGTALYARRTHKRELNEYILEKTEEVELDSVKGEALRILSDLRLLLIENNSSFPNN